MTDYKKNFLDVMKKLDTSQSMYEVFCDYLRLWSITLVNTLLRDEKLENDFKHTAGKYTKEQMGKFCLMQSALTGGLTQKFEDFLGSVYMDADFGSREQGQFFTPAAISEMTAKITLADFPDNPERIYTLQDPCIGGGSLLLACAEYFKSHNIDYSRWVYAEATDVSENSFRMAYIQLSLAGISGHVVWGNSLSLERFARWPTPMYELMGMEARLKMQHVYEDKRAPMPSQVQTSSQNNGPEKAPVSVPEKTAESCQLSLF